MKKLLAILLSAIMVFAMAGAVMAEEVPAEYTQMKVFDGTYGFGEAEITAYTNDDQSAFYITFECFDEDQILEGTIDDGIVNVDYDLSGFVSGDAQIIWDDAVASDTAWEAVGGEVIAAEDAGESAEGESAEGESDGDSAEMAPPAAPTAESEDYAGPIREYEDKALWFDSTVYGGFYSPYQIVKGNGNEEFDIDLFINSEEGEKIMSLIRYELALLGDSEWASDEMIEYWAGRGIVETVYNHDDHDHEILVYTPDYMLAEDNTDVYPVIFCFHGGGGTLFEATDHGFVNIAYDNGFIVVCPENESIDFNYTVENLPAQLDWLEEEGYPIDRTKVYTSGMSMGGWASITCGVKNADILAGAIVHSAANLGLSQVEGYENTWTLEEVAAAPQIPLYLEVGEKEGPTTVLDETVYQVPYSDGMITGLNAWLEKDGCNPAEKTEDNNLGVTADRNYVETIDGAAYTFAEYDNADGVTMVKLACVENLPHWVSYSYAQIAWDFMKQFSRVDGELVIGE
ncbi:MAG: hypothetical protein IJ106_08805 [Parasporobacterium sp.]|nr:hypothetical protein [Parasporobacterium sp.]